MPKKSESSRILCDTSGTVTCEGVVRSVLPQDRGGILTSMDTDLIAIDLDGIELKPGDVPSLTILYQGKQTEPGLYASAPFASSNGRPGTVLMASALDPQGARYLIPSYDIPKFRAVFNVSITAPMNVTALSNGAQLEAQPVRDGIQDVVFAPTPPMPAYLLAVVVGDIKLVNYTSGSTPPIQPWVAADRNPDHIMYAARVADAAMDFYKEYTSFGQPAEISKMDIVAVPGRTGSVENWGLVIFDEPRLFYDEIASGEYHRFQATSLVCHEIAHQWFGNLVTIEDYTQWGLKEGLATLMEYKCLSEASDAPFPADELSIKAITPSGQLVGYHEGFLNSAMEYSSDPASRPIISLTDLGMLDDPYSGYILYAKMAAMLRQFEIFVNTIPAWAEDNTFQKAIRDWIGQHYLGSSRVKDLMYSVLAEVQNANGELQEPTGELALLRAKHWFAATTLQEEYNVSVTADVATHPEVPSSSIGGLFFRRAFAYIQPTDEMVNSATMYYTLDSVGATQNPFCSWFPEDVEGAEKLSPGLGDIFSALDEKACFFYDEKQWNDTVVTNGRIESERPRFFTLAIAIDNFTDCSLEGAPATISTQILGNPEIIDAEPGVYDRGDVSLNSIFYNHDGSALIRTDYTLRHRDIFLSTIAQMPACVNENSRSPDVDGLIDSVFKNSGPAPNGMCCPTLSDLLEAESLISDILAFTWNGLYSNGSDAIRAIRAVAQSNVTKTPEGQFALLVPVAQGLDKLSRLAENGNCSAALSALGKDLLAPRIGNLFQDMYSDVNDTASSLLHFAAPQILWRSVLHGDDSTAADLCELLPSAPVTEFLELAESGEIVPPEIEAAINIVLALNPSTCTDNSTAFEVASALINCWEHNPILPVAERCLYAVPFISTEEDEGSALEQAIVYIVNPNSSYLYEQLSGETEEDAMRHYMRVLLLTKKHRASLLNRAAEMSSKRWNIVFDTLRAQWQIAKEWEGTVAVCEALHALPPPVTEDQFLRLDSWMHSSPGGLECSPVLQARIVGKALQVKKLLENRLDSSLCESLTE